MLGLLIELPDDTTAVMGLLSGVRPDVSQDRGKDLCSLGFKVSFCWATVRSPHRMRSVKV